MQQLSRRWKYDLLVHALPSLRTWRGDGEHVKLITGIVALRFALGKTGNSNSELQALVDEVLLPVRGLKALLHHKLLTRWLHP